MKKITLLFLFATLALFACDKAVPIVTPVTPPVTTDGDPAPFATPFAGVPATKDVAMYEVNLRAFSSEGTLKGVQARLDEIKALGINVLWLMPIHPIGVLNNAGQLGSPYSVRNYKEVSSEYGTLDDLQTLVKEAHTRNMAVIIDWVANHTAWDNAWITEHPDWYTKDASGKITIPAGTNWNDVADLDYSNAAMRKAMISAMKYWILKANIDGYRCDYADGVPADFWKQAIDSLKTLPNRQYILLAEGNQTAQFGAGFALNYSWNYYGQLKTAFANNATSSGLFATNNAEYTSLPADVAKLRFTTNHDESAWNNTPIAYFGGNSGSLSAFVLASYMGGVPLIYCGQEVGRADKTPFFSKSPINWAANPDMLAAYKRLMAFRQSSNAVKSGTLEPINDTNVVVFKRVAATETVLVIVNTKNTATTYTVAAALANSNWTNALDNTAVTLSASLSLQPYQYLILKR